MTSPSTQLVIDLFESSPNVLLFVKDPDGRYLAVSDGFVRRMRCTHRNEIVGRTVDDFFPPDLAQAYRAEDHALLTSGRARHNQLEVIADGDGRREWFLTSRVLHREAGYEDTIVAVSTRAPLGTRAGEIGSGLRAAIELAARTDRTSLRVDDLARAAELTTDQLERAMRLVLGLSPKQYLMQLRLERAATLLSTTDDSLADIASTCHYYDQSQFTKYFKAAYGLTPGQYREAARTRTSTNPNQHEPEPARTRSSANPKQQQPDQQQPDQQQPDQQ